ncbi:hypothetical protein D018_3886A, partial [Vibrio parahaemolyticus VP2007-007]
MEQFDICLASANHLLTPIEPWINQTQPKD